MYIYVLILYVHISTHTLVCEAGSGEFILFNYFYSLFHGCKVHFHDSEDCTIVPSNWGPDTKNYLNETSATVRKRDKTQMTYFQNQGARIRIMWECEFLKENGEVLNKNLEPKDALIPR